MITNLYALIEARPRHPNFGQPFYVGIGNSKRPYRHLIDAKSIAGHYNIRLHEVLTSHIAFGVAPGVKILAVCVDKAFAGFLEQRAIALYGRIGIEPRGTLCNLAKGGEGADPALMQLPEMRSKVSAFTKAALAEPETRKRHIAALDRINKSFTPQERAAWQAKRTEDSKARSFAALEAARTDPVAQAKKHASSKISQKAAWADPEIRARRIAAMRGKKKTLSPEALEARRANAKKANTPEANALKAKATQERWANPGFVAQRSRNQTTAWADPEKRANMLAGRSEGISKSWDDPEVRARRIGGIKAAAMKRGNGERGHDD